LHHEVRGEKIVAQAVGVVVVRSSFGRNSGVSDVARGDVDTTPAALSQRTAQAPHTKGVGA
jgi:hypothetical protein